MLSDLKAKEKTEGKSENAQNVREESKKKSTKVALVAIVLHQSV